MTIFDQLREDIDAVLKPWLESKDQLILPSYALEEPPPGIEADAACNLPLILAKAFKKSPRQLAGEMAETLEGHLPLVERVSVAGAGFLNFVLKLDALQKEIHLLLKARHSYGQNPGAQKTRILVEFVSANPTGPLHVGHGRGAALGDSLAQILSHLGHPVTREYYVNDAGNQVHMLGESILARCAELQGKPVSFPENGYHGDYVKDLAKGFMAEFPVPQQTIDNAIVYGVRQMTERLQADLEAFGVRFDYWFSEASLVQKGLVDKHLKTLSERGFVKEHDGALWFVAPGEEEAKDKDRVLKKRDGRWTYFATDIAYHADKFERGYDQLIDIWGADHHGYVPRVKGSMVALGHDASKLHVILNQMVALTRNGTPVVMSKRAGEFVTLRDVLDEVGKDACRFFFAMRGPNTALDFDLELAKKHTVDNPVYYLQYAHARICSIFKQAEEKTGGKVKGDLKSEQVDLSFLEQKEERDLMRRLAIFPQVLRNCEKEDSPHPLANYLLMLAKQFHYFYDHHRVLGDNVKLSEARLALLDAVRSILRLGLNLLGVHAPDSM